MARRLMPRPLAIDPATGRFMPAHGYSPSYKRAPTYVSWRSMLTRIRNRRSHKNYSGRGIDIDPRWHKFEAFLADMGERPAGLTLERVDNDRGYWPDNCVWATSTVQGRNRRDVKLTYAIAEEIRYMFTTGSKVSELARRYKLNIRYTYAVIARKTWAKP